MSESTTPVMHPAAGPGDAQLNQVFMKDLQDFLGKAQAVALQEQRKPVEDVVRPLTLRLCKVESRQPAMPAGMRGLDPALDDQPLPSREGRSRATPDQAAREESPGMLLYHSVEDKHQAAQRHIWGLEQQLASANRTPPASEWACSMTAAPKIGEVDRGRYRRWGVKEVGIFNAPKAWGEGNRFYYKEMRYYREVCTFTFDVRSYTQRNPRFPLPEHLKQLLAGLTYGWYIRTPSQERRDFYASHPDGVEQWLQDLEAKFTIGIVEARRKLAAITLGLDELSKSFTVGQYLNQVTGAMMAVDPAVTGALVMATAWYKLDKEYRRQVLIPAQSTTMADFVTELERRKMVWKKDATTPATPEDKPRPRFMPRRLITASQALAGVRERESTSDDSANEVAVVATKDERLAVTIAQSLDRFTKVMKTFAKAAVPSAGGPRPLRRDGDRRERRDARPRDQHPSVDKGDPYLQRNRELDSRIKPAHTPRGPGRVGRERCYRCFKAFRSKNQRQRHACANAAAPASLVKTAPEIKCTYTRGGKLPREESKARYAAFVSGFAGHSKLGTVVADTGCNCTLVSQVFLDEYVCEEKQLLTRPVPVRKLNERVESKEVAVFDLRVPAVVKD
ncbi:hypothetical protein KEM52_002481 [Ascosphaera acerosa]|nr:hypothetical protein KEM52_002481 [Ascosphaera acerosa]